MTGYRHRTAFFTAIIGYLLLMPLVAWGQQPTSGGTLRVAWESDVAGLDPHLSPGAQAWYVMGNLFNGLVTIDSELNYVPDLAESWEILEDGKVYVFHLRQGVKFHDGTDFDAEAVRWNYQRIMDPEEKALDAASYSLLTVSKSSTRYGQVLLKYPSATLLPVMAAHGNRIFADVAHLIQALGQGRRTTAPGRAQGRSGSPGGSKIRSSCWRRTPTTSSLASPIWIASSSAS